MKYLNSAVLDNSTDPSFMEDLCHRVSLGPVPISGTQGCVTAIDATDVDGGFLCHVEPPHSLKLVIDFEVGGQGFDGIACTALGFKVATPEDLASLEILNTHADVYLATVVDGDTNNV